jgi:hypothetical protein
MLLGVMLPFKTSKFRDNHLFNVVTEELDPPPNPP